MLCVQCYKSHCVRSCFVWRGNAVVKTCIVRDLSPDKLSRLCKEVLVSWLDKSADTSMLWLTFDLLLVKSCCPFPNLHLGKLKMIDWLCGIQAKAIISIKGLIMFLIEDAVMFKVWVVEQQRRSHHKVWKQGQQWTKEELLKVLELFWICCTSYAYTRGGKISLWGFKFFKTKILETKIAINIFQSFSFRPLYTKHYLCVSACIFS